MGYAATPDHMPDVCNDQNTRTIVNSRRPPPRGGERGEEGDEGGNGEQLYVK